MTTKPDNSGLLVIDKPQGVTSHDVVAAVRGALHMKRVGHAGTLDPMATGVLVVGFGNATRLLNYIVDHDKTYLATIRLGQRTTTDDADGELLPEEGTIAEFPSRQTVEDVIAHHFTGRIEQDPATGRWLLKKALYTDKDQSYVLYVLTQDQLAHTKFPLGGMDKPSIRKIAEEQGFCNARKHDSQDICFVPDGDYVGFMERYTGKYYPDGDFLDVNGNVVGRHHGAVRYTCGQRKGLGLALGAPVYVCGKDMEKNTVTVGPESELLKTTLIAGDFNWISVPELTAPMRVKAKARYRQVEQPATAYPLENGLVKVVFDEPQRAITRGQAVVLYDGDVVVGGGTIL